MDDSRKKPGWAFWTAVVVVIPLLYVLSFGPWVRLCRTVQIPKSLMWIDKAYCRVLLPLMVSVPEPIGEAYSQYMDWWLKGTDLSP